MKVGGSVGKEKISKITGSSPRSCLHLQLDINKIDFADAGGASRRFGQLLVHLIIRGTYINYVFCRLSCRRKLFAKKIDQKF